jgi:hypothetical protein
MAAANDPAAVTKRPRPGDCLRAAMESRMQKAHNRRPSKSVTHSRQKKREHEGHLQTASRAS